MSWKTFFNAKFFDNKGEYHGEIGFNKNDKTFKYKEGRYVYDSRNLSYYQEKYWFFFTKRTFFYSLDNPQPMDFSKKRDIIFTADIFNIIIETDIAKKLNELSKSGMPEWLNWKTIGLGLLIIGVLYYAFTHGGVKAS